LGFVEKESKSNGDPIISKKTVHVGGKPRQVETRLEVPKGEKIVTVQMYSEGGVRRETQFEKARGRSELVTLPRAQVVFVLGKEDFEKGKERPTGGGAFTLKAATLTKLNEKLAHYNVLMEEKEQQAAVAAAEAAGGGKV
jgi:hypothetical protein